MRIDTVEKFLKVAKEIHGGFYTYDRLVYKRTSQKGVITCPKHGDFEQRLSDHIHSKAGCIQCSGRKFRNTANFIEDAKNLHGDLYDYSKFEYINNRKKSIIICKRCGCELFMTPFNHLQGNGCKKCNIKKYSDNRRHTNSMFIEKAKKIHGNRYDYSKIFYRGSDEKVTIICEEHGEFYQSPSNHLSGHGCFKCMRKVLELKNRKSIPELLCELNEKYENILHDIKIVDTNREKYDLSKIMVSYVCNIHGRRESPATRLLYGISNCDLCNKSSGEVLIDKELKKHKLNFITEYSFDDCKNPKTDNKLYFDFYILDKNKCIEFDGQQHFIPVKYFGGEEGLKNSQYRDSIKNQYCLEHNIPLLRIRYDQINIIDKLILDFIYD